MAVSSDGSKIYIADSSNCVIRMVDKATGNITTIAGKGDKKPVATGVDPNSAKCLGDFVDGPALQSNIDTPKQLFLINQNGVDWLYITDYGKSTIRKVDVSDPSPQIVTVAGNSQGKTFGGDGGQAISAQLNHAEGVWVANDGSMYITDGGNNLVRKVDPSGIITTIAGDRRPRTPTPLGPRLGDDDGRRQPATAVRRSTPTSTGPAASPATTRVTCSSPRKPEPGSAGSTSTPPAGPRSTRSPVTARTARRATARA